MLSSKPDLWENLNACIRIQIGSLKSRQKNKEGALKQSGTQQRADSKYQSRNSKKMAFHGCLKGIIWVWIFLKNAIIWWRWSQGVSRGAWGGLQESADGWNQAQHRPSPMKPLLWKGCGSLAWRPVRHVRAESRRQLEEPRWMRKHRMRKGSNWKPLWWHQEQSQRRQPCYRICPVIIIKW